MNIRVPSSEASAPSGSCPLQRSGEIPFPSMPTLPAAHPPQGTMPFRSQILRHSIKRLYFKCKNGSQCNNNNIKNISLPSALVQNGRCTQTAQRHIVLDILRQCCTAAKPQSQTPFGGSACVQFFFEISVSFEVSPNGTGLLFSPM